MTMTTLSPTTPPIDLLDTFGPAGCAAISPEEARAYAVGLAQAHYENFSVLSRLVPRRYRADFAAIYAFCRWSDDLADETGAGSEARQRSLDLLSWWRGELERCAGGEATHPVYLALRPTIERCALPIEPFHRLLDAFEQDQRVTRYDTMAALREYCTGSADPVGRLVLLVTGQIRDESDERIVWSDAICTGLQLANFWQDVRRDLVERDRIYLPLSELGIREEDLRNWMRSPEDASARQSFTEVLQSVVEATREELSRGEPLLGAIDANIRPVIRLFLDGGRAVLTGIERSGYATLWQRPTVSKRAKLSLIARAWAERKLARVGLRRGRAREDNT
ncbi:MAG: squalene synthase HpnC [Phycisphaerales bacterium]|nr:squalene synthase HpnC [Phycisphaerales bacterium]